MKFHQKMFPPPQSNSRPARRRITQPTPPRPPSPFHWKISPSATRKLTRTKISTSSAKQVGVLCRSVATSKMLWVGTMSSTSPAAPMHGAIRAYRWKRPAKHPKQLVDNHNHLDNEW